MKHNIANGESHNSSNRESEIASAPQERVKMGVTNQALVVGVLAAIAGWYLHVLSDRNERDSALPELPKRAAGDIAPTLVTVSLATIRSISQTIDVIGSLTSFEEIPISSKVDGTVQKLYHDVGARVQPGDLLVDVDPESYRLAAEQAERSLQVELAKLGLRELPPADWDVAKTPSVMQAKARLNQAESRWSRLQKLATDNAASESDLDNAKSDFESANAEREHQLMMANSDLATIKMKQTALEIAQRQWRETKIAAPLPTTLGELGEAASAEKPLFVVSQRMLSEGTFLRAGTQVYTLAIDGTLKLRASVPEKFSASVAIGQTASITTAAVNEAFVGSVTNVHPTVDPKTRTFEIELQIPNPRGQLKPGNFAKAALQIGRRDGSMTVPLEAIVSVAGINKLYLMDDGKAREVHVTLGTQTNEWVEVLEPQLNESAIVITSGYSLLSTGSAVQLRETEGPAATAPNATTGVSAAADNTNPLP